MKMITNRTTIFFFLRYMQPIWYFNLKSSNNMPYWVNYHTLNDEEKGLIQFDDRFKTEEGSLRDAAYQAWHKGIISFKAEQRLTFSSKLSLFDEYRFVKKYYNPAWSFYVLFMRLITLNNPFCEVYAFLATLKVMRVNLYQASNRWTSYQRFTSELHDNNPKVSVVIPTLNRYPYLKDVLTDLERQDYKNKEVIVVDQSEPFQKEFYEGWKLDLQVVNQQEKALWQARNHAIKMAKGEIILLYDDDSRVEHDWISEHLKCLDFFKADFSAGVSLSVVGAKVPANYSYFRWADQFDTGNVMIRKEVFWKVGLFDRQFEKQRMGDGEFGLRAYLAGCIGISNPNAKRIHLKVESGGLRQMGSWDGFRPTSWLAPRPIPSVLYLARRYFGDRLAILDLLIKVPTSILPLQYKDRPLLLLMASMFSVLMFPFVVFQVIRSWRRSSGMIAEGPKIDNLT